MALYRLRNMSRLLVGRRPRMCWVREFPSPFGRFWRIRRWMYERGIWRKWRPVGVQPFKFVDGELRLGWWEAREMDKMMRESEFLQIEVERVR